MIHDVYGLGNHSFRWLMGFLITLNVIASYYTGIFLKIVQFLVFGVHWVHQDPKQSGGLFLIMRHTPAKLI